MRMKWQLGAASLFGPRAGQIDNAAAAALWEARFRSSNDFRLPGSGSNPHSRSLSGLEPARIDVQGLASFW